MSNYVYPESCGDYYPKRPVQSEIFEQLATLTNISSTKYLYVDEKGILQVSVIEKVWEIVRAFFGFINRTDVVRVNSEILKLMHFAVVHGEFSQKNVLECVKMIKVQLDKGKSKADQRIKNVVQEILKAHQNQTRCNLTRIRRNILEFHVDNEWRLQPGFWHTLFNVPNIIPCRLNRFGHTHLQLATLAIHEPPSLFGGQQQSASDRALRQYQFANFQRNSDPSFQDEFRKQFTGFVTSQWGSPNHFSNWSTVNKNQTVAIRDLIHSLSRVAKSNNEYPQLEDFTVSFGLPYFPEDQKIKALLCESRVKQSKFADAFTYRQALEFEMEELEGRLQNLLPDEHESQEIIQTELKETCTLLGDLYSNHHPKALMIISYDPDYETASRHYLKAWQYDDTAGTNLEVKVFQTLMMAANKENTWFRSFFRHKSDKEELFIEQATEFINHINFDELKKIIKKLESLKQYDKAIHFYEFAAKKFPNEFKYQPFTLEAETYHASGTKFETQNQHLLAYEKFTRAYELVPTNSAYKSKLFRMAKQLAKKKLSEGAHLSAYEYFHKALECANSEKDGVEIKSEISNICLYFANFYVARCHVPNHDLRDANVFHAKWKKHKVEQKKNLLEAISWYDKGLQVEPQNARLHFDKAELIEYFELEDQNFIKEYQLAVQYNRNNPFYLMRLSESYCLQSDLTNADLYRNLTEEKASHGFGMQFLHWFDERFTDGKIYRIDPHI